MDRIRQERTQGLRRLLRTAMDSSPWHRRRLNGIHIASVIEDDLEHIPVMTKDDLMDNFDEVITDRRVTRDLCDRYLESPPGSEYLLDQYHVVASGGSSGHRGVFVYSWDAWAVCWASMIRFPLRDWQTDPDLAGLSRVAAVVAASKPTHVSAAFRKTFSTVSTPEHLIPVDQTLERIVADLNDLQPTELIAFSSVLSHLARVAQSGNLHISPRRVAAISEPLLPEIRAAVERAWGVPIGSRYGMSEGLFTGFCGHGSHLPDDLCILEPVDAAGKAVRAGVRSERVYVTNLYNPVMPLIRFEVTDEVTVLDERCACGSAFRRISDPQGRLDDTFVYQGGLVVVHPHLFRSPLGRRPGVLEYQVRQTERGADIRVATNGHLDLDELAAEIEHGLTDVGLASPQVSITEVGSLVRQASGKLKRFFPLRSLTKAQSPSPIRRAVPPGTPT
jgi:phenylacetate-coenzyme A ligase PaaK-like adenylate-forming protein